MLPFLMIGSVGNVNFSPSRYTVGDSGAADIEPAPTNKQHIKSVIISFFFTIKEVADKTGITAHTLRYYEREGIMPSVKRDAGGNRFYDEESIEGLNFILALRSTGIPLSKIKQYVSW